MTHVFLAALSLLGAVLLWPGPAESSGTPARTPAPSDVVVNGQRLSAAEVEELRRVTGDEIPGARYWYDPVAGWWGYEGGPVAGIIAAGLALGGPLASDASGGTSDVFVNGRELPKPEWLRIGQALQRLIPPGRYWINAQGIGGPEGGAADFDLRQAHGWKGGRSTIGRGLWSTYDHDPDTDTEWPGFRITE